MKTETIKNSELYSTADLTTAVTLSLFFPIEAIDKANPKKAVFFFKRQEGLDRVLERYWRRELSVEPQAFAAQLKTIKTRLYWEK